MLVEPSERSKQDLREISQYIAKESPAAALLFLNCVEETYSLLGEFPEIGHIPLFDHIKGLKTVLVKNFKHHHIFYRIVNDVVRIDRVADGRRHLQTLLNNFHDFN
ncbi:MAG: type II toxin-antitoxin system RelE/ParE family toxin [Gammaproteobacteria bacterium]|nr:type II toxin-antitoxin system RelE/ParE family toxin [Gammaproteobacteria bacterium]